MSRPKLIAFYLPQFHPTPDNDQWWGKGYTEWTNVAKARPLYHGHYQPKLPADLGFYDLRLPETREEQAKLAREAGIDGFCYWSYWFGDGKEELELPFNEVLASGKPDFPFMLCWANESWHSKFWNKDGSVEKVTLVEQRYPGRADIERYFYHRLPAFRDSRYIKESNKPVFMIYQPGEYAEVNQFIAIWNELARKEGFDGIYFIAHAKSRADLTPENFERLHALGFNAINTVRIWTACAEMPKISYYLMRAGLRLFNIAQKRSYKEVSCNFFKPDDVRPDVFPTLVPNWDHSPRSGKGGVILHNASPELFGQHASSVLEAVKDKPSPNFVFIRAWNEWGEGNYMEPDLRYGKGYIEELRKAVDNICKNYNK